MKKNLKKRKRGKIAAILFVVVAVLFVAALLVVGNLKSAKQRNQPNTETSHTPAAKPTSSQLKTRALLAEAKSPDMFMLVSYPSLFTFLYA